MNMDDVLDQILRFEGALEQFAVVLDGAWRDIEQRHANLDPDWNDEFKRSYMRIWVPLEERLSHYRTVELPKCLEGVRTKERQARDYLSEPY